MAVFSPGEINLGRRVVAQMNIARPPVAQTWRGAPPTDLPARTVRESIVRDNTPPDGGNGASTPYVGADVVAGSGAPPSESAGATTFATMMPGGGMGTILKVALVAGAAFVVWKIVTA